MFLSLLNVQNLNFSSRLIHWTKRLKVLKKKKCERDKNNEKSCISKSYQGNT